MPSLTLPLAVRTAVTVSMVSVTLVTAAVGSMLTVMPPPLVPLMLALTVVGSM